MVQSNHIYWSGKNLFMGQLCCVHFLYAKSTATHRCQISSLTLLDIIYRKGANINGKENQNFLMYTLSTPYTIKRIKLVGNIWLKTLLLCLISYRNGHIWDIKWLYIFLLISGFRVQVPGRSHPYLGVARTIAPRYSVLRGRIISEKLLWMQFGCISLLEIHVNGSNFLVEYFLNIDCGIVLQGRNDMWIESQGGCYVRMSKTFGYYLWVSAL